MAGIDIRKGLLLILVVLGWFAIISQFYLTQTNGKEPFLEASVNFFSYFTILTNILVAICTTSLLLNRKNRLSSEKAVAAITVYIAIVGAVYNLVLRSIWDPQGLQRLTDELLHTIVPLLTLIYWIAFAPKSNLQWRDAITWLVYPLIYSVYTLIHGSISNWYPYPFIDPNKIGWSNVAVNSVYVLLAFLVVSLLAIASAKMNRRRV